MRKFLTGVAAIALAASAATADPGGGKGNGGGKGGGGNDHSGHVQGAKGGGDQGKGKGGGAKAERSEVRDNSADKDHRVARDRGKERDDDIRTVRGDGDKGKVKVRDRDGRWDDDRDARYDRDDRYARGDRDRFDWDDDDDGGMLDGCPPGLSKVPRRCMPYGQAKKEARWSGFDHADWWGLRSQDDGRYRYYDGNLVRLGSDNSILSYLPLLGGALAPGNVWPSFYQPVSVPDYYRDYYGLGSDNGYRYADDVLYRIDPQTSAITSIAALLTGDDISVGQTLPLGYDVYNVPYSYRDRYADGPDANYRYSDGYIYQVDPKTQLVAAVIELLT